MRELQSLRKEIQKIIQNDPAHDFEHIMRVCRNARKIARQENANEKIVLTAALLHDVVWYPKSDNRSRKSSVHSADLAKKLLKKYDYTPHEIKIITDAIRDHSFSRNKVPETIEGKVLQDADRLDALGAVGIARTFSAGGSENRPIYNVDDPFCRTRKPNDKMWTLDHFYRKLLLLEEKMNTKSAKREARRRTTLMKKFLSELKQELQV